MVSWGDNHLEHNETNSLFATNIIMHLATTVNGKKQSFEQVPCLDKLPLSRQRRVHGANGFEAQLMGAMSP